MPVSNSPRVCNALSSLRRRSARVREVSFCKRSVVASKLRCVASEYGQLPREVLAVAFQKTRRAAQTELSKRMSRRLAHTQYSVHQSVSFGCVQGVRLVSKKSSQWRPLSDCVTRVLRDVRVVSSPEVVREPGAKLN